MNQMDLTTNDGDSIAPIQRIDENPMSVMARLAYSGKLDVAVMERFMDLQDRYEKKQAAEQFGQALSLFQAKCPKIEKKRGVSLRGNPDQPDYYFASYQDIMDQIKPTLESCGLSVTFSTESLEGQSIRCTCSIRCSAHVERSTFDLPIPTQMKVNSSQQMGAANSYAKRYALVNALNIPVGDEDNDAANLGIQPIDDDAKSEINQLLKDTDADREAFFNWIGVDTTEEMTMNDYLKARGKLRKKFDEQQAKLRGEDG